MGYQINNRSYVEKEITVQVPPQEVDIAIPFVIA